MVIPSGVGDVPDSETVELGPRHEHGLLRTSGDTGFPQPYGEVLQFHATIGLQDPTWTTSESATMSAQDVLTAEAMEFLHLLQREFADACEELLVERRRCAQRLRAG